MSRIFKQIEIEGKPAVALFDTGATLSYVRREFLSEVPKRTFRRPTRVGLGGKTIEVREACLALAEIEGWDLEFEAVPVDDLGAADGHALDAMIGALAMERWEIRLDPKNGVLDLAGLRRREFTEF